MNHPQNNNGARQLLQPHVWILLALYDAKSDRAKEAMSGTELAETVNNANGTAYLVGPLWNYVRSLSQMAFGQIPLSPDKAEIQIIGDNGQSRARLTGPGLEAARREYAKRQTDQHARSSFQTGRGEIVMAQGQGGGITLLG